MAALPNPPLLSEQEYRNTSYEPDVEFADGVLVRRNVGTQRHGLLQTILAIYLGRFRQAHRFQVFTETRLQVRSGKNRIPDTMVVEVPYQKGDIVTDVPLIVIEVKSPDDTFDEITGKCLEYEALGVPNILVMDPDNLRTWIFELKSLRLLSEASFELALPSGTLDLPLSEMLAEASA